MKEIIINELRSCKGGFVSGEALSEALGVSRTAVWKNIKTLKEEGYIIESSSKKGYRLVGKPDILNRAEILYGLNTSVLGRELHCFEELDSTNTYAKRLASEGCADGAAVVAEKQTRGRGRLGRQWESAGKKGVWMSVVLKPSIPPESIQLITLAASVAVVDAVFEATGIETGIKWPNDIILDGKKVCGILAEMSSEMDRINYLVIGIGINVNHDKADFPDNISATAISLKEYKKSSSAGGALARGEIIKKVLFELEKQYLNIEAGKIEEVIDEWKKRSVTLGKKVKVNINNIELTGMAAGITEDGKLLFKMENGDEYEILSGEVSVRGLLGYV